MIAAPRPRLPTTPSVGMRDRSVDRALRGRRARRSHRSRRGVLSEHAISTRSGFATGAGAT